MNSSFVAESAHRVQDQTDHKINDQIRQNTIAELDAIGFDQERIAQRLQQLDKEWDIERAIEANASTLALAGLALGASVDKRWFMLPAVVATFLLQHSIQGWCPPVPILRRLGFRTQREINNERAILLARKGEFQKLETAASDQALAMLN